VHPWSTLRSIARMVSVALLDRVERSSPKGTEGVRLDGEGADQTIIGIAVMSGVLIIVLFLQSAFRIQ
jgi:hypothetical protein